MEALTQFDPTQIVVAGVPLLVLVFGLVEFFKSLFNMSAKPVTVLSFVLAGVLGGLYVFQVPYLTQIVMILSAGLAASGFYKFLGSRVTEVATGENWRDKAEARQENPGQPRGWENPKK